MCKKVIYKLYVYASTQGVIEGAIGSIKGLVILSVYQNILNIHRANLDNTYGKC